ncbi:MAG TPA: hypothetical protein VFN13_02635 [Rudaea sp.]|nr:hypothetical protein [Rudaea sp.]
MRALIAALLARIAQKSEKLATIRPREIRTNWPALVLSILFQLPIVVAALLVMFDTVDVALIVAVGPLELMRVIVLIKLSEAYRNFENPSQALRYFLTRTASQLGIFGLIFLIDWIAITGVGETAAALSRSWIWIVVAIPIATLVAENALNLFFVSGDVRAQAARLEAMASDATVWFVLMFFVVPILILAIFFSVLLALGNNHGVLPNWIAKTFSIVVLLYPATYFAGKAIVLAQVHTARFALTGQAVFGKYRMLRN